MACPFEKLGLTPDSTESEVLYACGVQMLADYVDGSDPNETERERELVQARDECLEKIRAMNYTADSS
jgi:hypothetical protein